MTNHAPAWFFSLTTSIMAKQSIDPGLGTSFTRRSSRIINKDGKFNVRRLGSKFSTRNLYQELIMISWRRFLVYVLLFIFFLNALFALIYMLIGVEYLAGARTGGMMQNFFQSFFFSFQTFTTVGYGHISPTGTWTSLVAALEAIIGLMSFAMATGLLYGRFSRPSSKLHYSEKALIAPYRGGWGLMFRIANARKSQMMDMKASVTLIIREKEGDEVINKFFELKLERDSIQFFPLSWTIVHPIDEDSPFHGIDFRRIDEKIEDLEVMILLHGFDDTFGQEVHSRCSYLKEEIHVGGKFIKPFYADESGQILIHLDRVGDFEEVEYS